MLDRVAATRSRELFTLTVLVIALGIAIGAATLFGVSMALGAFLAGLVVARSDYSLRAATDALPMRDAFAVLFFVSIGMLLDPAQLLEEPALVLAALGIVLFAKPIAAALMLLVMRYPLRTVLTVAVLARPDRRVLVHPDRARARPWHRPRLGHEHRRCGVNYLDHVEPPHIAGGERAGAVDRGADPAVAAGSPG